MSASERGDVEIVTLLITAGVDVNITDSVRSIQYLLFCVSLFTTHVCHHTGWRLCTDDGCQEG